MNDFSTCPHFSLCSGCAFEGNVFDPPIKKEISAYFESNGAPIAFFSDGFRHARWKAKLAVRGTSQKPEIGLFRRGTHSVVSIPECQVHHPAINKSVAVLKQAIQKHRIEPYSETTHKGLVRYAQVFVERKTGRAQLALSAASMPPKAFLDDLSQMAPWHSIWINLHPDANNKIFGDKWIRIHGEEWLWQTLNNAEIAFHPGAFSQAHLPLFEKMLSSIENMIPEKSRVLELFAGVGAISFAAGKKWLHADLIENNPLSELSFKESLKRNDPAPFRYHLQQAATLTSDYDAIIVDPPRKGLGAELLASLEEQKSPNLIYVSCQFSSFRRDADDLRLKGWKIEKGEGYFLFPGTDEIEVLALFHKSS